MTEEAALGEPSPQTVLELSAAPEPRLSFSEDVPEYDPPEVKLYSDLGAWENHNGWWVLLDGRICIPQVLGQNWLNAAQFTCHQKKKKISALISTHAWLHGHQEIFENTSNRHLTCAQVNAKKGYVLPLGQWSQDPIPGEFWELDFTEVKARTLWTQTSAGPRRYSHGLDKGLAIRTETAQVRN